MLLIFKKNDENLWALHRNDVSNFCRYHPNNPIAVSPHWIVESLKKGYLEQPHLFPPLEAKIVKKKNAESKRTTAPARKSAKLDLKMTPRDNLFQDAVFHLVDSSKHDASNMVTYDLDKVEELIITHGGQLLSDQVITMLQKEKEMPSKSLETKQKTDMVCYVVNVAGEFTYDNALNENALLSTLQQKQLCEIVPVNPIFIETCIASKQFEDQPQKFPELFQPQWPMFKLPSHVKIKVSVSGFQNSERIGLRQLLIAIGATYTDNMGNTNTHLVCKEAKGPKYHKAIEWGLHVVTVG